MPQTDGGTFDIADRTYRLELVATDLEVPWSLVFDPDGNLLIAERPGRIRLLSNDSLKSEPLLDLKLERTIGEGGLMGLALHPDYSMNRFVFVSYSYPRDESLYLRIVRYSYSEEQFEDETVIFNGIPVTRFNIGGALTFGPDGKLYLSVGDTLKPNLAQQRGSLAGKVLRLNDDGSIPSDNPPSSQPGSRREIWSIGHRNIQGFAWQPSTGSLFVTEHGPNGFDGPEGGDEINMIRSGGNYGWPSVSYSGSQQETIPAVIDFSATLEPGGCIFYTADLMPDFKGCFLFTCLRGARLVSVRIKNGKPVEMESFLRGFLGRIRAVAQSPDGAIYFSTSNRDGRGLPRALDDKIYRILPIETHQ
jgi:glucose/arabinose dehydrogenase